MIGDTMPLTGGSIHLFGPMLASMEESMLEGPVLGEVHPTVVLVLPPAVPELTNHAGGKFRPGQGRNPEPLVIRGM